jgi:hypothetical protein
MLPKIEELASLGLNDATIAAALQMHPETLSRHKNRADNPAVLLALKAGRLKAIEHTARQIKMHAAKNPIAAIYRSKAILGRHDDSWLDQRQVQHSGTMTVSVYDGVSATKQVGYDAIEADYVELDSDPDG